MMMKKKILLTLCLLCLTLLLFAVGCDRNAGGAHTFGDSQASQGEDERDQGDELGGETNEFYTVSLVFDAALGSVSLSPVAENNVYKKGTSVTATISPLYGKFLSSFEVDGEERELTDSTYTFTVERDITLEAEFRNLPMPASLLDELRGAAYAGEGTLTRLDGKGSARHYTVQAVFDGDLVSFSLFEGDFPVRDEFYKNEEGKAVSYTRNIDNTVARRDTGEDFSAYRNPFDMLSAEDFILTNGGYSLSDAQKAKAAAFALTGMELEIGIFLVRAEDGTVFIDGVLGDGGEETGSAYASNFVFTLIDPIDIDDRSQPYERVPEHAALETALRGADAAESYRFHVAEGTDVGYDVFVTKDAIFSEKEGRGYCLHDGVVCEIFKREGKLVLGEPVTLSEGREGSPATSDIALFQPSFSFAPELFEPKDGMFGMRRDSSLLLAVADRVWNGSDVGYVQSLEIFVENSIRKIAIAGEKNVVLTYSDWNETQLPYPFEGEDPAPTDPPVPTDPPYPAKFIGKYAGENWEGVRYTVEIAETVSVSLDGGAATVTDLGYDAAQEKITLRINGTPCTVSSVGDPDAERAEGILLAALDVSWEVSLSRVTEDEGGQGEEAPPLNVPQKFFGTYEGTFIPFGAQVGTLYRINISENGVSVSIDGVGASATGVEYNEDSGELVFYIDGVEYLVYANSNDDPLSEIVLWFEMFNSVILVRVP